MKHAILPPLLILMLLLLSSPAAASELEDLIAKKYPGRQITIELHDTDIRTVLEIFAELLEQNIVIHKKVSGKVRSLLFVRVPVDQAFETFCRTHELYSKTIGNVTTVYPREVYLNNLRKRIGVKGKSSGTRPLKSQDPDTTSPSEHSSLRSQ